MKVRFVLSLALFSLCLPCPAADPVSDPREIHLVGSRFKLDAEGLQQLAEFAEVLRAQAREQEKELGEGRAASLAAKPAEQMTLDELKRLYQEPADFIDSKKRRGLGLLVDYARAAVQLAP